MAKAKLVYGKMGAIGKLGSCGPDKNGKVKIPVRVTTTHTKEKMIPLTASELRKIINMLEDITIIRKELEELIKEVGKIPRINIAPAPIQPYEHPRPHPNTYPGPYMQPGMIPGKICNPNVVYCANNSDGVNQFLKATS